MTEVEQRVRDTVFELTRLLVEEPDSTGYFARLADHCVDLLGVAACSLTSVEPDGRLVMLEASTMALEQLHHFELLYSEGPAVDCVESGSTLEWIEFAGADQRWPSVAPAARSAGFDAVYAVPMRLREQTVGAITLYTDRPQPLDPSHVELARTLANVASLGVGLRRARRSETLAEQLQSALHSRVAIEQAKGILAERLRISVQAAFDLLRGHARANGRRLDEVANAVTNGELNLRLPS